MMTFVIKGKRMRVRRSIVNSAKKVFFGILTIILATIITLGLFTAMVDNHYRILNSYATSIGGK